MFCEKDTEHRTISRKAACRRLAGGLILLFSLHAALFSATLTVGEDGPYRTLGAAIKAASDGDSIVVRAGTYREANLLIDKTLTIIGESYPVIDGQDQHEVITITADSVILRGLAIHNSGMSFVDDLAGIRMEEVTGGRIEDCRLINNFFAIYLAKSSGIALVNNQIVGKARSETTSGNGIHLWYCRNITVSGNQISGHRDGIYFEFVQESQIDNNLSEKNLRYGLHFMFSDHCQYRQNSFRRNGAGVAVMYTEQVLMENNVFELNWGSASFGLLLKDITDSRITGNLFYQNSEAIYAENSSRIIIENNDFVENGWALKIYSNCLDNRIAGNNFVSNAFDVATNSRNNFNQFDGNYWSSYSGYDLDRDGIGDVPYRPVRLFSLMVVQNPPALIMLRSLFVDLLDVAERIFPVLTPETLLDKSPHIYRLRHQRTQRPGYGASLAGHTTPATPSLSMRTK